jgi:hypothetical protein
MANGIALIALIGATRAFFVLDGSGCWIFCVELTITHEMRNEMTTGKQ